MSGERPAGRVAPRNAALSDEAIDWVVRLGSGSATDADRAAFEQWRARSPAHQVAVEEATSILENIACTRTAGEYLEIGAAIRGRAPHRVSRRTILAGSVAAAAAVAVVGTGTFGPPSGLIADYATGVGGRERIALKDGSVVWLNTASALSVAYSAQERRLTLHDGEALFEVARDKARPFIVVSGAGQARALGTVYGVRRRGALSDVVVTEGIVEVRSGAQALRLAAGQQVSFGADILGGARMADGTAATAWTRGKLIFNRRPLGDVAAELERYQMGKVVVVGEELKRREVTGVFDIGDIRSLLRTVSGTMNVRVTRLPLLTVIG